MAQEATVAVVGGGLAGLAAAVFAARSGARVTLFERMSEAGGRARTRSEHGFLFNMGPHALYQGGPAMAALRELGIEPAGKPPATSGGMAYNAGQLHALPGGTVSLLTTGLLRVVDKLELASLMTQIPKLAAEARADESYDELLLRTVRSERVRGLLRALARLTSYAAMTELLSAQAGMAQLASGLSSGVRYLDGGWQVLVDGLERRARESGVELRHGVKVERVTHDGRVRGLELEAGERVAADAVILALGPGEASELVDGGRNPLLASAVRACVPLRAACLDLALAKLPNPKRLFALGIDRPLYFSVHSAAARLAPEGGALVSVARYLGAEESPSRAELDAEFETLLDAMQPGWRAHVVTRKLLRDLLVAHDLPQARRGGLAGRASGAVTGISGLFLAGDWVGPEAMLADASLASARLAARAAAGARGVRVAA
ncbi:MAG TPA: FAD-dependent oxidoreductase [Myxococcota bacterium]|nr:FAD-dependent oxidoreductase [Myxococcota bacterium]